jgi:hypothetical protein
MQTRPRHGTPHTRCATRAKNSKSRRVSPKSVFQKCLLERARLHRLLKNARFVSGHHFSDAVTAAKSIAPSGSALYGVTFSAASSAVPTDPLKMRALAPEAKVLLKEDRSASIGCRCTTLDSCNDHVTALRYDLEENTPVPDAPPEAGQPLQFADIALKRILLHLTQRSQNSGPVACRDTFKSFSCWPGEDDGPFHRGTPRASHSYRVCKRPFRDDKRVPRRRWATRQERVA